MLEKFIAFVLGKSQVQKLLDEFSEKEGLDYKKKRDLVDLLRQIYAIKLSVEEKPEPGAKAAAASYEPKKEKKPFWKK